MASTVLPNGIIIPEKFSRDWYADLYHNWQELDNLLGGGGGGGGANDGTLTIQKNGNTVGTFSANQATDETVNITVPTATSELTNDSNFVESSDLATVATSGSYNDLSNKPTIPTVNNATLTIQKNGTDVATFSANSSTNATANITVPTKTSDLTNDSGFITSDNTKIPLAGSNAISGDLIPATDNSIDVGSSTKNIKMLYTKGITIDGKTIDTDANDNLTYDSHIVDTIEEQGTGYIRYSNGIQICWGMAINSNNIGIGESIYTLPKAFNNSTYSLILTAQSNAVYYVSVMENSPGGTVYKTNTQFGVFFCDRAINPTNLALGCNYIAIGTWK